MNRVLLVRPHYGLTTEARAKPLPYLGHLCVAASLREAGFEVTLVDEPGGREAWPRIEAALEDCLYVGLSAMTVQVPGALDLARRIRSIRPELPLVWGGVHPTLFPDQTCDGVHCDVVVVGEGDETAVELARAFAAGGADEDLAGIAGIVFRRERAGTGLARQPSNGGEEPPARGAAGELVRTGLRPPLDLDRLPRPAYDLLTEEELRHMGISTELAPGFSTLVPAGRGCPYRCSFCVNTVLPATSRRHRIRSAERMLDDIAWLQERYGVETFLLQDEDLFARRDRVERFLDLVAERGMRFHWQAAARANYFRPGYIDEALIRRMADAGCVALGLGAESGSSHVLEILLKDIEPEQVEQAVRTAAGSSLTLVLSYMIGVPGEGRRDILRTLRQIAELAELADNLYVGGPYIFRPYPGSRLYEEAVRGGLRVPETLTGWASALLTEEGFLSASDYPWMTETRLTRYATTMVPFLYTGRRGAGPGLRSRLSGVLQRFLRRVHRTRAHGGFYDLLVEDRLLRLALALRGL